jgi:hypothetical protein
MSTLNFPTNPSIGDTYTIGTNTWVWTGSAWIKYNPLTVTTSTVSTSTNTGAVVVAGGIGVGGAINVGSTSTILGAIILTTATVLPGTDIQIVEAPDGTITINNTSTLQTVTDRGATTTNIVYITNTTESTSTNTGALIVDGGIASKKDVHVAGTVHAEHLKIQDAIIDSTYVSTNTTATIVIDRYPTEVYRSAKYLVQIDEGVGPGAEFQVIEILLLVTNDNEVYTTNYGLITSNGELGEFSSAVDDDNPLDPYLELYFTPYQETEKTITVLRTAVTK